MSISNPCRLQGPFKTRWSKVNELVAWNRLFLLLKSDTLWALFLSVAVDRFAPSRDNHLHALSLRFALVRRRVQCSIRLLEIETGRRRLQPRRAARVDFFVSATTWFEVPCELYFFQSFFWRVVYIFFSLLDGPSARSCCSSGPHVCRSTRQLAQPRVFWRWSWSESHGRMSLATESGLRESGESFHIEEKKVAALRGRASSRA